MAKNQPKSTFENKSSRIENKRERKCCENPHLIDDAEGLIVCINCGLVYGPKLVSYEVRAYNQQEVEKRKRTTPFYGKYGARTVIKTFSKDANGHVLPHEKRRYFYKLDKINKSLVSSIDRNYMQAMPLMLWQTKRLRLPNYVFETAWMIYKDAAAQKLTMGRAIEDFVSASLFIGTHIHDLPYILHDIKKVSSSTDKAIHSALELIVRNVLPKMGFDYKRISIYDLIYRFGRELDMEMKTQENAKRIFIYTKKRGMKIVGKDPKGIAGAVLYLAGKLNDKGKTQKQVSSVTKITEVTLRNRIKQVKNYLPRKYFFKKVKQ